MATQTEKILSQHEVELTQIRPLLSDVVALRERLAAREGDTTKLHAAEAEIALLKHQIAELAKTKDTWGNRVWLIATITLSAFFATTTAVLGALLTFTLNAKK